VLAHFVFALSACAAGLAWATTRRRAAHRPVALLLTVGLASDIARQALADLVLNPARARFGAAPWEGWARVAGHAGEALFLAWPAALAASALVTFSTMDETDFAPRHWRTAHKLLVGVAAAWLLAVVALVVTYPITRGGILARCYLAAELGAIVVGIGSIATWIPARRVPEVRHVVIALVIAAELTSALVGPWRVNVFGSWVLAQVIHALLFALLTVLQGGVLWISSSPPSSS
jgi:hypothetical protein